MLDDNTIDFFLKNLHENRVKFPEERNAFVFVIHMASRRHEQTGNNEIAPIRRIRAMFLRLDYIGGDACK